MVDDVSVTFGASIEKLIAGIDKATDAVKGFAKPFEELQSNFALIGEAIAAAFAVERIAAFFENMAELGVQTQRTAALLGISTQAVSGLDIAAKASGGSLEGMTMSLERFGLALVKGDAGSKQQSAALSALGMSAKDFVGVPLPDVLAKLSDSFAVMKDGIDKDAIAMALLGRGGAQMIPIFNQGSHAFEEFADMAKRAGTAMSEETAVGFEHTHLGLIEMEKSFQGVGISVASIFKPAFDGLVKVLTDLVQGFNNSIREGGTFKTVLDVLSVGARGLATALVIAVAATETLWEVMKSVVFAIGESMMALGRIIKDVFTLNFADISNAWTDMTAQLQARAKIMAPAMETIVGNMMGELKKMWGDHADEVVKIEQTKVARMQIANKDQVGAAMKAIEEEIKLAQEGLKQKTLILNGEANQHQITQNTKFSQLQKYTNDAYQIELALLQKEQAIAGMTLTQQQDVLNKIKQLKAKHETDMIKLDQESIAAQQKLYTNFFTTIQGAFNAQLRGLLAGTTTFAQAFKSILGDLIIKFIEYCEKTVMEWVAAELAKTTATTTGAAARGAAEATGQGVSMFATIGNAIKSIFASAGMTTAEVTAEVAPVAGPAAPGIGAAAGAATLASAMALVPSLDIGTDFVTSSGLAMIHRGESIKPAQTSGPFTGGGDTHNFNFSLQAWDARSVNSWLNGGGARQLAQALGKAMSTNPSLKLA